MRGDNEKRWTLGKFREKWGDICLVCLKTWLCVLWSACVHVHRVSSHKGFFSLHSASILIEWDSFHAWLRVKTETRPAKLEILPNSKASRIQGQQAAPMVTVFIKCHFRSGKVYHVRLCQARIRQNPLWLWNPEETSSEVRNRGVNGPIKGLVSSKNQKKKKFHFRSLWLHAWKIQPQKIVIGRMRPLRLISCH